jgi:hypothetical protein
MAEAFPAKVLAIHEALEEARVAHAVGGAIALGYYAIPRATVDIDINVFVEASQAALVLDRLARLGVDIAGGAEAIARMDQCRVRWEHTPVDLFFSDIPLHDAMKRAAHHVPFSGKVIPILAPEHLMVCKALFDRGKDWLDIESMMVTRTDLRAEEVMRWMDEIAGADDHRTVRLRAMLQEFLGRS